MKKLLLSTLVLFSLVTMASAQTSDYFEGFEGWDGTTSDWLPEGWTEQHSSEKMVSLSDGVFTWHVGRQRHYMPYPPEGQNYAVIYYAYEYDENGDTYDIPQDEWLFSPTYKVSETTKLSLSIGYSPMYLFDLNNENVNWGKNEFINRKPSTVLKIYLRSNGGEWKMLHDLYDEWDETSLSELFNNYFDADFYNYEFDLSEYAGTDVQVAFQFVGMYGNSMAIDEFKITAASLKQVDYTPSFTGEKERTDRNITAVSLSSVENGDSKYSLEADAQKQCYVDATKTQIFKVAAGEEVYPVVETGGSWVHFSVYVDADANGFTAGIAEGSEWQPTGDLVSYSFYNNGAASDEKGWNSVGDVITGDDRNKPELPAFVAPTVPGTYRMRYKLDWCSIDPMGDQDGKFGDFMENGGQIVDVMLEVIGEEPVEPLTVNAITPKAGTVESLEQIVVTFDKELASVDASKISVAPYKCPIEAYAGKWELTSSFGESYTYDAIATVEVVEIDGVKKLKAHGVAGYSTYDDTFYMSYDEATGNITLADQDLAQYNGYDAHLFMGYTENSGLKYGELTGKIVDGNIVFESEDGADSFIMCYNDGETYRVLSYFCELTWTPANKAAAPVKAFNINTTVDFVKHLVRAKAPVKANDTDAVEISASVNGNELTITTNVAVNGTYKLTIAEGAVVAADGATNKAVEAVYDVYKEPTYEYNEGDRNHGERALTSFTITDGTNSLNVTDIHQTGKGAIFVDKTDNVFETTAGAAVSFSEFNYLGVWMHAYAYIDYNNDYTFGQDANATGTTGGELVTYNCYSTDGGSTYQDIWGNTASASNANSDTYYDEDFNESKGLPHFFLPADLAAGDYRMRIKVDWNNLDPVQGSKDMVNGGCEVDFIVRVAEATGIENVEVENGAQVIYDLTGRKVENANVRGIYIINGKKVLVK